MVPSVTGYITSKLFKTEHKQALTLPTLTVATAPKWSQCDDVIAFRLLEKSSEQQREMM